MYFDQKTYYRTFFPLILLKVSGGRLNFALHTGLLEVAG